MNTANKLMRSYVLSATKLYTYTKPKASGEGIPKGIKDYPSLKYVSDYIY